MVLEVYLDMLSPPCRAVWLFLNDTGIPFEANYISLAAGESGNPEIVEKTSLQRVPFIVDDGFVLTESAAIIKYLATKHKVPEHWYPRMDQQKQAKMDEFINWQHMAIRRPMLLIFRQQFLARAFPEMLPEKRMDQADFDKAKDELKTSESEMCEFYLGGKPFVGGDDISIGDVIIYCELMQLSVPGEKGLYECSSGVEEWKARIEKRLEANMEPCRKGLAELEEFYVKNG